MIAGDYSGNRAMRWTQSTGIVQMQNLAGTSSSTAHAISGNGDVVVGASTPAAGMPQAVRWTASGIPTGLGYLPGGNFSVAWGTSFDGSVIVGNANSSLGSEAFRWTQSGGMQALGDLAGGSYGSDAAAASGDGSVVVGSSTTTNGLQAGYYWRADIGMVNVNQWLPSLGINLTGWFLGPCKSVSADGRTFVGSGTHNGHYESWIATIPEPASLLLLALGAGAPLGRPARRRD